MLTWYPDRAARTATACLLVAVALTAAAAVMVASASDVSNALAFLLGSAAVVAVGGLIGSLVTSGVGVLLIGLVATLSDLGVVRLAVLGALGLVSLLLLDMSLTLRRAPDIDRRIWRDFVTTAASTLVAAAALTAAAVAIANITTWHALVVPFALLALGVVARLVADAHASRLGR